MKQEKYFESEKKPNSEKMERREFIKKALAGLGGLWLESSGILKAAEGTRSKSQESTFNEQDPEKIVDELKYIVENIGGYSYKQLGVPWGEVHDIGSNSQTREKMLEKLDQKPKPEKRKKKTAIMESLKDIGLQPDIVQRFLKTLPGSWRKEVDLITYVNKPAEVIADENTKEKDELVAHHQSGEMENSSEIYFFPGAKKKSEIELLQLLIYEHAHVNNWRNRGDLNLGQRINLLYNIIKRVESPDRFKYELVEKICCKDKKKELIKKAVEYWAAICMHALMLIKPTEQWPNTLPPKADMRLVFNYLKTTDPDFDILNMAKKRFKLLEQVQAAKENKKSLTR